MVHKLFCLVAAVAGVYSQAAPTVPLATIGTYCQGCHNESNRSGGVSVEGLKTISAGEAGMTWEKILRKVRTGEMPPLGLPRPKLAESAALISWMETELDRQAVAKRDPGSPLVHRLNRAEYSNAIRDLVGLRMDHADRKSVV